MRLLIVGTFPPPVCGTTVSLQHLVQDLERHKNVNLRVIDTRGIRGTGVAGLLKLCRAILQLLVSAPRQDTLALHLNPFAIPWLGPIAVMLCRVSGTRLLIRLFGGNCFSEFHGLRGLLFRWSIRHCDVYLAQTKAQVESAQASGIEHVHWFPTSRPAPASRTVMRKSCRRFLFVGWVSETKGIRELIQAGRSLDRQDIEIDVYGPFREGVSERDFEGQETVRYRGMIDAGKAIEAMARYHALVLPTRWIGEGYPGVVLEAFQAGLPVIATRWRFIPEIVDDSCGVLIEPGCSADLSRAIGRLASDDEFYHRLQIGAREKATAFSTSIWTDRFVELCGLSKQAIANNP